MMFWIYSGDFGRRHTLRRCHRVDVECLERGDGDDCHAGSTRHSPAALRLSH